MSARFSKYLSLCVMAVCAWHLIGLAPAAARVNGPRDQVFVYLPIALRPVLPAELPALQLLLNEANGATQFADAMAKQPLATCQGDTCPQAGLGGKIGAFTQFDGINDALHLPNATGLNVAANEDLSIGLWLYPTDYRCGYCRLVNKFDGLLGYALDLADNGGHTKLTFYAADGTHAVTARSHLNVLLNAWHHVVVVLSRSSSQVKLYLDGAELALEAPASTSALGDLSNNADVEIGHLGAEPVGFQGLLDQVEIYKRALSTAEISAQYSSHQLPATPNFHKWNSRQMATVLRGLAVTTATQTALLTNDLAGIPVLPAEGSRLPLPDSLCTNCSALLLTYSSPTDWAAALQQYNTPITRAFGLDNFVLVAPDANALTQMSAYTQALTFGMLESIFDAPNNATLDDYLPWANFYPASRGQQRDTTAHKGQRTYDRWEGPDNTWLYGQSTWRYQDPDVADAPPPGLPATYEGRNIDYYIQSHCEKTKAAQSNQDCINLEIFIETLSPGADDTELFNWWSGGWSQLLPTTPNLWTFYNPAATFASDGCYLPQVQAHATDAELQDVANRVPLRFRLPKTPGVVFYSPEVCTLFFNNYLFRAGDVTYAYPWRVSVAVGSSTVNTLTQRTTVQAENRYFERLTNIDNDVVYRRWSRELYWMLEILPTNRLDGGFNAFWFGNQPLIEDKRELNLDPTWSAFEWCRLDKSQGPVGWGRLACDANP